MDEVTAGAITAVWHRDSEDARRWFDLVADSHQALLASGAPPAWEGYRAMLAERARHSPFGPDAVDGLVAYLERHSPNPLDVIAQLADSAMRDELVNRYALAVEHGAIP